MTDVPFDPAELVDIGNPAGSAAAFVRAGISPTEGLRILRDNGAGIREGRWYALYGQVSDTLRNEPAQMARDPFAVPSADDYGAWAMGRGGQYATQVEIQIIDRETQLWSTRQYTYVTDTPHTPAQAQDAALDEFGDPETESAYGETIMGATATSMWQTVPFDG